jgi:DNA-binding NarL/FixJ family response regulator
VVHEIADPRQFRGIHSPVLVLIDMASIAGTPGLGELASLFPDSGLILWVDRISSEFVRHALNSGIRGILRKDAPPELYFACLSRVAAGHLWLEEELNQRLLRARPVRLSPRERQLVGLLTEGLRNKEIAGRMNIAEGTAKAYLSRLFEKTGASDRFELAMFALQNLEPDPATVPSRGSRIFAPLRDALPGRA